MGKHVERAMNANIGELIERIEILEKAVAELMKGNKKAEKAGKKAEKEKEPAETKVEEGEEQKDAPTE